MLQYAVSGIVGLVLGLIVNVLADRLPAFKRHQEPGDSEENDASNRTEVDVVPASPQRRWLRYAAVQAVMLVCALYLWGREGLTTVYVYLLLYAALFLLIAVIDVEHLLILDVVMLPAFVIALIEIALSGRIKFVSALAGYALGQIVIMGLFLLAQVYLWVVNTNRQEPVDEVPFGFGDVTLATFCGMLIGFPHVIFMLILMVFMGGGIALLTTIARLVLTGKYKAHTPIPYGPAIILAAVVMLLWGQQFVDWLRGSL